MSYFYIYECRLIVLCNLVIRKVIYTWGDSCYDGSELSYVSVLVFRMYLLHFYSRSYLFSIVCIYGLLCLSSELFVNVQVLK